ncbi:MAG: (5-formylfuran-3-yl)methyl phosphate synthase [Promethearchaeota archaeon]
MKVLISPSNHAEIINTLKGEPDIIDIKNPKEGSLGANFPWVIKKARQLIDDYLTANANKKPIKLSAVIGDFPNLPGSASLAALGAAVCGVDYIKVGLMGPNNKTSALYMVQNIVRSVKEYNNKIKVVIAGYADYRIIQKSLDPLLLPDICAESGADIVMVDTAVKNGKTLFDNLSIDELKRFIDSAHDNNLEVAIAGALKFEHINIIKKLEPDIIGVRSMVCEGFDRTKGIILPNLINDLKKRLNFVEAS